MFSYLRCFTININFDEKTLYPAKITKNSNTIVITLCTLKRQLFKENAIWSLNSLKGKVWSRFKRCYGVVLKTTVQTRKRYFQTKKQFELFQALLRTLTRKLPFNEKTVFIA